MKLHSVRSTVLTVTALLIALTLCTFVSAEDPVVGGAGTKVDREEFFYNVDGSNNWHKFRTAEDMFNDENLVATGNCHWSSGDGFLAADGYFYNISSSDTWHKYSTAWDMFRNQNQVDSGSSHWDYRDGFFAADGAYYNIDGSGNWHKYRTAEDMFANVRLVASGRSHWNTNDGFFAVNGAFYNIDASENWHQFDTAEDMFNNVNEVASGESRWWSSDGFFAMNYGLYTYVIPAVAHNPGVGGTMWRTDVAVVNTAPRAAELEMTYFPVSGSPVTIEPSINPDSGGEFRNVLELVFDVAPSESTQGTILVSSTEPLILSARTYNQVPTGSYGQYLPACTCDNPLVPGVTGYLPGLKSNAWFRTNLGMVNVGLTAAQVRVRLFDHQGSQIGASLIFVTAGQRWKQVNDIFGGRTVNAAYATIEVQTQGAKVWVYASVVDNASGDPTTIPVLKR